MLHFLHKIIICFAIVKSWNAPIPCQFHLPGLACRRASLNHRMKNNPDMDLTLDRITYIAAKFLCPVVPSHIDISCYLNQNVSRILLELTSFVYLYININLIEGTSLCFVICDRKGWAARCLCPSHRPRPLRTLTFIACLGTGMTFSSRPSSCLNLATMFCI